MTVPPGVPHETVNHLKMVFEKYLDNPPDEVDNWDGNNYRHRYWDMVREMKDDQFMASQPSGIAIPILRAVVGNLRSLGYDTSDQAADDLAAVWDKVKLGMQEAPLAGAVRLANFNPLAFQTFHYGPTYQRFLNICYRLQLIRGDDDILLPVNNLAKILAVSPKRISDYRGFAKLEGYLSETAKAYTKTMATKFRFRWRFEKGVGLPCGSSEPISSKTGG